MVFYNDNSNNSVPASNFNEAGHQINRLHNSWCRCRELRLQGDYNNWRWELDIIWSELNNDALNVEKNININEYFVKIRTYDKLILIALRNGNGKLLYSALDLKEKLLRRLQNISGKGSSYKTTDQRVDF